MGYEIAPRRSFLVRAHEVSPGWVLLYTATLALAFACAWLRAILLALVGSLLLWVGGRHQLPDVVYLAVALTPLVISVATIILPTGGLIWQVSEGARRPSERERHLYSEALHVLLDVDPGLRTPRRFAVLDVADINAFAYADSLIVTRGLLESGFLQAVLAHELGHLNSADSRLAAALSRLTTAPRTGQRGIAGLILFVASGSFALWVTRIAWANYWRAREYAADAYAARLGQAAPLALLLEADVLAGDLPIPYAWIAAHSHPSTEHRIDRLLALDQQQPQPLVDVATGSVAVKVATSWPPSAGPDGPPLTAPDPSAIGQPDPGRTGICPNKADHDRGSKAMEAQER